jgi:drug/metabolite transporter (DMT)-like permease
VIFLSEVIQIGIAIGGAFILAGVVLTDRAERKLARSSAG